MEQNNKKSKQERFVQEYMKDLNGTQAAIRSGYSPRTANEQAAALLAKPSIRQKVDALKQKLTIKNEITAERVLQELAAIAFVTLDEILEWDEEGRASVKSSNSISADAKKTIADVEFKRTRATGAKPDTETMRIRRHDKIAALALLAQYVGIVKNPKVDEETEAAATKVMVFAAGDPDPEYRKKLETFREMALKN